MNTLRAGLALALAGPPILVLALLQAVALRASPPLARRLPIVINRIILAALGVRLRVRGGPAERRPLLLVANHVSWLDIPVLFAIAPVRFVSKSEVARWPIVGWLARLGRTVFVRRGDRASVAGKAREVAEALRAGDAVVVFPEGTTTDGNRVLAFKSGLLGAVRAAMGEGALHVQPLAIAHTHASGLPLGRATRHHAAYPGSVSLGRSLLRVLREGSLDVAVDWDDPVPYPPGEPRKPFAADLERRVRALHGARLADAGPLTGGPPPLAPVSREAPPPSAMEAAE